MQFTIVICNFFFHFTPFQVVYKIIDLGYAKQLDQESLATTFVGTLKYVVGIYYFYRLFEVGFVGYGTSFFYLDLWPITFNTDGEICYLYAILKEVVSLDQFWFICSFHRPLNFLVESNTQKQ